MKRDFIKIILFTIIYLVQNNLNAQDVNIYYSAQDSVLVTALRDNPIPQFSSIATKLYIPIQQIPMSVGVVNNALINNQNNFILGDALRNISGVNTQTGFGVHDYFIIRGFNSLDNALILIDGTPFAEAGPRHGTWDSTRDVVRDFAVSMVPGGHEIVFRVRDWRGGGGMVGPVYLATDLDERIF